MKDKGITLSPKHGLNPSLLKCPICGKDTNEIALLGKLKDDAEAPRYMMSNNPCPDCQEHLDKGDRILIEVKNGETGPNPYRTGRILYIVNPEALPDIKSKISYIEESLVQKIEEQMNKED